MAVANIVLGLSDAFAGIHGSMISMVNEMPVRVNSAYPALMAYPADTIVNLLSSVIV